MRLVRVVEVKRGGERERKWMTWRKELRREGEMTERRRSGCERENWIGNRKEVERPVQRGRVSGTR